MNIVGTAIDPEVEEFPGTPGRAYYVNAIDFWKAPFSHHMFLSATKSGSAAEAAASALGVGNRTECVNASSAFGEGTVTIGGAARSEQSVHYPPGVGLVFYGGQKLVLGNELQSVDGRYIEFQFSEPHLMKAGEAFRYECD